MTVKKIKSFGIIFKYNHAPAREAAEHLKKCLSAQGIDVYMEEMRPYDLEKSDPLSQQENSDIYKDIAAAMVLGGDGTLLGAARILGKYNIPILGINLGGLGFLTSIPLEKIYDAAKLLIEGKLEIENRLMLEVFVVRADKSINDEQKEILTAFNDVVINKGSLARIIDLEVLVDDEHLMTFRADGLIIATPTGSTAYNLSAGGPILYPTMNSIVITPICPFIVTNRPIIVPDNSTIRVRQLRESHEEFFLTMDGQIGLSMRWDDSIIINKSEKKISLYKSPYQSYFSLLRKKLMWSGSVLGPKTTAGDH